jgi:hypothetical protein
MLTLHAYPNRGARFGHQFFESALARAFAIRYGLTLRFPKGFEANSRKFGAWFDPSDASTPPLLYETVDAGTISEQALSTFIVSGQAVSPDTVTVIECDFQRVDWLNGWMQRMLPPNFILLGLESHAMKLRARMIELQMISPVQTLGIAVHVRRENVTASNINKSRYVAIEYYTDVIQRLIDTGIQADEITVISTPDLEVEKLTCFAGLHISTVGDEVSAFAELANHSHLVGSPSGFSYTAHLAGNTKIMPHPIDWNPKYRDTVFTNLGAFVADYKAARLNSRT